MRSAKAATGADLVAGSPNASTGGQPGRAEPPDLSRTCPDRVSEALQAAWAFYSTPELHRRGSDYLASRGIDVSVLEERNRRLEVGHTPPGPAGLVTALRSAGYHDDELVDAGLAQRYDNQEKLTDFYRERVLIPIHDKRGRAEGLIGRNVGDNRYPKYKNPPHTHTYDKSVNLYQPLPAPEHIDGQVVIVEGVLDALAIAVAAISSDRGSFYCPVTQSGRELSEVQMRQILKLHATPLVLGFDGDEAGLDSARRYLVAFSELGTHALVAVLPCNHDPASWLAATGPGGLSAWLSSEMCGSSVSKDSYAPTASTFAARHLRARATQSSPLPRAYVDRPDAVAEDCCVDQQVSF